jgi:hypothetical protein
MSLDRGFKFRSYFYDQKIIDSMTYDELSLLIDQVYEEIKDAKDFIEPFSNDLKSRLEVPENVKRKLKYKDAIVYFSKDLKEIQSKKR